MSKSGKPNKLIHSSSPYLKQHAYNPVDWHPWGKEALQKAKDQDKPMIISIGYSACHWCHVMERESFENEEIAQVMNEAFVCIKVDREERPDVDQLYMEAIQNMGINGGWPLNVFAMPDQRPFYGGTYFQPRQWMHILKSISEAFREKRNELEDSAASFAKSLTVSDSEKYGLANDGFSADLDELRKMTEAFKGSFDQKEGGLARAPKFPNPSIWRFLLIANSKLKDREIHDQIMLTLRKMAAGGIYDQIGGGFARYSTDDKWFAPHFEKMLYDNAQLVSLYSMGYQVEKDERFREVVYETIDFVKRELTNKDYGFFSALDADSEGEEGNYYVWTEQELDRILGDESEVIKKYYQTRAGGNWERGVNILHTKQTTEEFAKSQELDAREVEKAVQSAKAKLMAEREKREKPGLDDKILCAWNAMMLRGLIDAYHAFGEPSFLDLAEKNASFFKKNLYTDGKLWRIHSKDADRIPGFLDDYAFAADAFLALYQATFKIEYLDTATALTDFAIENFYDPAEELFFYSDKNSEQLIARKKEIFDNVIPASNSVTAQVLYQLGMLTDCSAYLEISQNMIAKIAPMIRQEPQYLSNWGSLYAFRAWPTVELAVVGDDYKNFSRELMSPFIPNKIISADKQSNSLPLLKNRSTPKGRTSIYVCFNKTCKLPVQSVEEAFRQMESHKN